MNRLKKYFLENEYCLKHFWSDKSFCFEKTNGEWTKTIYISKYGKVYKVSIIEGLSNFIKSTEKVCNTYKDVIKMIS